MKLFLVCFLLALSFDTMACLNEHHVTRSGKTDIGIFGLEGTHFYKHHNHPELELYISYLKQENNTHPQLVFENENSIAVALIKLGRLPEAEAMLDKLYSRQPGDYSVVVNLGTLYELQGNNKKALDYIKKAISINPQSHGGSEWFHVKVLEFKLKNIPDSAVAKTSILELTKLNSPSDELASSIKYQLEERIPFTPAPNLLMAKILDEYAGFLADKVSIRAAWLMYDIATDYDPGNILAVKEKREALWPLMKKYKVELPVKANFYSDPVITVGKPAEAAPAKSIDTSGSGKNKIYGWLAGIFLLLAAGVFVWYRKRRTAV